MKFLDEAVIFVSSGPGGHGACSFRREKFIPKGGPDGGNGGRGGSVIFEGSKDLNTLIDFRYTQHYRARRGEGGAGRNRSGRASEDIVIYVPLGTEVIREDTQEMLLDIKEEGERVVLLKGGKGGRGNASFATSVNRAPRQFTKGEEGQEMYVRLRLKVLADVGLLGLPNAGKSTFISSVSNAKPKVADYPFTTLHPNLGMVRHHTTDMVIADLPGLIEGAAEGHGLGHRFLKHLSRCAVQLHLIDATSEDPAASYKEIRNELIKYDDMFGTNVSALPEVVVLTKIDAMLQEDIADVQALVEEELGRSVLTMSSLSKIGLTPVLDGLKGYVDALRAQQAEALEETAEDAPEGVLDVEDDALDEGYLESAEHPLDDTEE